MSSVPEGTCFIADAFDDNRGDLICDSSCGSNGEALVFLVGVQQNPAPAGSTMSFSLTQGRGAGVYSVFAGTGTLVSKGMASGTWSCDTQLTSFCAGQAGTFSAVQQ
jgi:hypothetical protein